MTGILELGEQDLSVLGEERAGSVTVVNGIGFFALGHALQVAYEHGRLGGDCRGGLGGGQGGRIATVIDRAKREQGSVRAKLDRQHTRTNSHAPNVLELLVLCSSLVDFYEAGTVGKFRVLHKRVRAHRRGDVHKIKVASDLLLATCTGKDGGATLDTDKVVLEQAVDAPLFPQLFEHGAVFGHTKHDGHGSGKVDLNVALAGVRRVVFASALPCVEREPHGLLGSSGALDRASGVGEDGATGLERFDVTVHLVACILYVERDR